MMRPVQVPGAVAFLAAFAVVAGAQEPSPSPSKRYHERVEVEAELPAVPPSDTTALKDPLPVALTPASVSVVPGTLLATQKASFLGDALRNAAGVNVANGFGVFDFFVIRGFDSLSSNLVLTDGAPEPESTFYPVYNLQQVEVVRGPGAYVYGGGPLAGAVNLVRKQPRAGRTADVSAAFGSFRTVEATADVNLARSDGMLALRLNAFCRRSDAYRDEKDNSTLALNPVLRWRPDESTRLALNLEYVRPRFAPDVGLPLLGPTIADVPRTRSYQSPLDVSDQDLYRVRLDVERRISDRLTVRNKLYYTDLAWRSDGTLFGGVFPTVEGPAVVRNLVLLDDRQKLFGNQLEAVLSFATGGVRHRLLAGFEASRLADRFTQDVGLLPMINLFLPDETTTEPVFVLPGLSQAGQSRALVLAPYVLDRVSFSERFQVVAGGRLDTVDFEDRLVATDRKATRFSPIVGVVFSPGSLSLYANGGAAFAPPSSQVVGERDPEESRQIEVGIKKTFLGGKAFATLAAYQLKKDNIAIPDATGFTRQSGDQRARGLEVELSAEAAKGWFTYFSYALNDAELTRFAESVLVGFAPPTFAVVDRSGNRPAFAPRHLINLWTTKQFANGLGLALGSRYVSRQFIAEDNAFAIDDYLVLDAMVSLKRGRWRFAVNLRNLTDRDYETRGFTSTSVLPADPFSVYGKVEIALGARAR